LTPLAALADALMRRSSLRAAHAAQRSKRGPGTLAAYSARRLAACAARPSEDRAAHAAQRSKRGPGTLAVYSARRLAACAAPTKCNVCLHNPPGDNPMQRHFRCALHLLPLFLLMAVATGIALAQVGKEPAPVNLTA